jgi:hypothetical protein
MSQRADHLVVSLTVKEIWRSSGTNPGAASLAVEGMLPQSWLGVLNLRFGCCGG